MTRFNWAEVCAMDTDSIGYIAETIEMVYSYH